MYPIGLHSLLSLIIVVFGTFTILSLITPDKVHPENKNQQVHPENQLNQEHKEMWINAEPLLAPLVNFLPAPAEDSGTAGRNLNGDK